MQQPNNKENEIKSSLENSGVNSENETGSIDNSKEIKNKKSVHFSVERNSSEAIDKDGNKHEDLINNKDPNDEDDTNKTVDELDEKEMPEQIDVGISNSNQEDISELNKSCNRPVFCNWTSDVCSPFNQRHFVVKIILVGDLNVGKSALVERYIQGKFSGKCSVTLGVEFSTKLVKWGKDTSIKVELWDMKGNHDHKWIVECGCHNAHAALVVYDVLRPDTLHIGATRWIESIRNTTQKYKSKTIPIIIIANKCDYKGTEVNAQFLSSFCYAHNLDGWFITSAKEDIEVDTMMTFAIRTALQTVIQEEEKETENIFKLTNLGNKTKKSCF
ncbi:ras-related protein Rab-32-like [Lycorma delicatula]|uniref:ras-related protein Rab-32-like n=1 Tax=Lycorma delicatula TaxID=130591 RepID=UPI003F51220B